jgi:TetR/AcrR family transcriptional repressor of nem operon
MRVSREQAAENREKILSMAARLFREKGFDGIGIGDLMKSAGLTHGGFYGHFSSKEDLMAQSCERAIDELLVRHQARAGESDDRLTRYQRFIANYLSSEHRDNPGSGCLMAALGADAARQSPLVKRAFTQGANRLLSAAIKMLPAQKSEAEKREEAMLTLATLVGAQVLARALDDPELSEEILRVVQKKLH